VAQDGMHTPACMPKFLQASSETSLRFKAVGLTGPRVMQVTGLCPVGYRDARFVVFEPDPWRGYANQQFGIVSSLALALLSDRALLIHGGFWFAPYS